MEPCPAPARWELYRLLAEPVRLRLLALAAEEELAIGELAELLREGQPNVSRHVAPLKKAGLVSVRRHGTRVLVRSPRAPSATRWWPTGSRGRALCEADGSLVRVAEVIGAARCLAPASFSARPAMAEDSTRPSCRASCRRISPRSRP